MQRDTNTPNKKPAPTSTAAAFLRIPTMCCISSCKGFVAFITFKSALSRADFCLGGLRFLAKADKASYERAPPC